MSRDKIRGAFALHALGDSLGAPHEFYKWNRNTIYTGKLEIEPYRQRDARHFAKEDRELRQPVGSVTDDTQMTYCLMNSIIKEQEYNRDAVCLSYMRWVATKPHDLGSNTRYIFGNKTIKGYNSKVKKLKEEIAKGTKQESWANGPLMRCLPLALLDDWETICREDTNISNPYKICRHGVLGYLSVLRCLLQGSTINDAIYTITDVPFEEHIQEALDQALHGIDRDITGKTKGLITHAFYCSIRALLMVRDGSTHEEAIKWVITQGTTTGKGDTDTNAAIAGALIGAYLGYDVIMASRRTRKNWRILQATASQVDPTRLEYVPYDFDTQIDEYIDTLDTINS